MSGGFCRRILPYVYTVHRTGVWAMLADIIDLEVARIKKQCLAKTMRHKPTIIPASEQRKRKGVE